MEFIKAIIYGIIEGITEWLPVSSTGHLILAQGFLPFGDNVSPEFPEMFNYVIQLGAIFAVIVLFWSKLWPFKMPDKGAKFLSVATGIFKKEQWPLWWKVFLTVTQKEGASRAVVSYFLTNCGRREMWKTPLSIMHQVLRGSF